MAKARALDRRRKSIRNIRKITRTMELISTARFKRAMDRATAAAGYSRRMTALVKHLARSGLEVTHPLLEPRPEPRRAILLVLTGNRGLCAGYNSSVVRHAFARYEELGDIIPKTALEVSGKRGISAFRFRKIKVDEAFTHFEDKPSFAEVDVLASRYMEEFTAGRLDRLDIAYTRFENASRQQAVVETLLPLAELAGAEQVAKPAAAGGQVGNLPSQTERAEAKLPPEPQYEFLPSAESILEEVVPMSFK
ncbi:MAG: FoF1 ATP synthase subunit gamma, partial [Thermoguttaceae bacterium]